MDNKEKARLLGMSFGAASGRLKKQLLFSMAGELGRLGCYRCGYLIERIDEFSIEHKEAWGSAKDPVYAFFSLENISFSHINCNIAAGKRDKKYFTEEERRIAQRGYQRKWRKENYTSETRHAQYLRTGK